MADMKPQGTQAYGVPTGYESADTNVKAVVSGLTIILVSTLVVMAAMYGMFNVLHGRFLEQDAKIPVALTERIVPPEPRLLPSPYTDEYPEAKREAERIGANVKVATEDGFPWDKRDLEIEHQYDEANSYGKFTHYEETYSSVNGVQRVAEERTRIPVAEAIKIMSGSDKSGTPAIMTWQLDQTEFLTGKEKGSMILETGKKHTDPTIFDNRAYWESQDEKFNIDSTGGGSLKPDGLSR